MARSKSSAAFESVDITGEIGPIGTQWREPARPMYSYDRPAYTFWNGVVKGLMRKRKLTVEQALEILQSKLVRWMLDGHEGEIEALGEKLGAEIDVKGFPFSK